MRNVTVYNVDWMGPVIRIREVVEILRDLQTAGTLIDKTGLIGQLTELHHTVQSAPVVRLSPEFYTHQWGRLNFTVPMIPPGGNDHDEERL